MYRFTKKTATKLIVAHGTLPDAPVTSLLEATKKDFLSRGSN